MKITKAIKEKFYAMTNELSPENLACDGEISKAQARAKFKTIMIRWHNLEDKIGIKVTQGVLDQWEREDTFIALLDSCAEGLSGEWDPTGEGKQGFEAMYESLLELAKHYRVDVSTAKKI